MSSEALWMMLSTQILVVGITLYFLVKVLRRRG